MTTDTPARDRLLKAAKASLARNGFQAMSVNDTLKAASVPKGVMYHHFPGGKAQLAAQAILALGEQSAANIRALASGPNAFSSNLKLWFEHAGNRLQASRFELGCPLATTALELGAADELLRPALQQAFATMRQAIETVLSEKGMPAAKATSWAFLLIATFEGALLQARVNASLVPLEMSLAPLLSVLDQTLQDPTL